MRGRYKTGEYKKCLQCGKEFYCRPYQIDKSKYCSRSCTAKANYPKRKGLNQTGKTHSIKTRTKISNAIKGEKCHFWKGGRTKLNRIIRGSFKYKLWRTAIFKRDDYSCVWCGNRKSGTLNAHHIKPFAQYPELRFAVNNGITLCEECHKTTKSYLNNADPNS